MNDNKSIDLKTENTNLTNELIVLRRKYKELDEDRHYVKSLLDAEFEKGIELKKEYEQLRLQLNSCSDQRNEFHRGARENANRVGKLKKENEQLKKEKEFWKSDACSLSSLNSILSNELSIAQEQGYEPSTPYKEYITSIKTEYDKFWENKIKTHNNRLKELEND